VPIPPTEVQRQIAELVSAAEENYTTAMLAAGQRRAVAQVAANNLLMGALVSE
jgi:restriction endonuclease S subunit